MKLTAELSLYPLQQDYLPVIQGFIDKLGAHADLEVAKNAMSTQICGEYAHVFDVVSQTLQQSVQTFGKQVLVVKFIPWELDI